MDTTKRDELRALLAAATPGPWDDVRIGRIGDGTPRSEECQVCNANGEAAFIVTHDGNLDGRANVELACAAVNALPGLLDRLDALEAVIADCDRCAVADALDAKETR